MLIKNITTRPFTEQVANFPDDMYRLEPGDHLRNFMEVILSDPGVGQLSKLQTIADLGNTVSGVQYSDLDKIFGRLFGFPRHPSEQLDCNPFYEQLTAAKWQEIEAKDASYRGRIQQYMTAVMMGTTMAGMSLAAKACVGSSCHILEGWKFLDNIDINQFPSQAGSPVARKEILIVPDTNTAIPLSVQRTTRMVMNRFKPADALITFAWNGVANYTNIQPKWAHSPHVYNEIVVSVTGTARKRKTPFNFLSQDEQTVEPGRLAHSANTEIEIPLNGLIVKKNKPAVEMTQASVIWSEWLPIEVANSPDNYPTGRNEDKEFSWESQQAFMADFTERVEQDGGEINGGMYRLPIGKTDAIHVTSSDFLADPTYDVETSWYGDPVRLSNTLGTFASSSQALPSPLSTASLFIDGIFHVDTFAEVGNAEEMTANMIGRA